MINWLQLALSSNFQCSFVLSLEDEQDLQMPSRVSGVLQAKDATQQAHIQPVANTTDGH